MIDADREQIWRVVNNLLVNAMKFSGTHRLININSQLKKNIVQIQVADQGIGIPKEMGNKIFDPFTEAQRKGTSGEDTFGLGLYISKSIVEAHGGKIWFEDGIDNGTIFYFTLPVSIRDMTTSDLNGL